MRTEGRKENFLHQHHTPSQLPEARIPFFPLLSHMTTGQSLVHSQHQELLRMPSPLHHAWGHLFLWGLGGLYSPLAHQRSFPEHAENLTQFGTGCFCHCPSYVFLQTQLMHSFLCMVASCACCRRGRTDNKSTAQHLKAHMKQELTAGKLCLEKTSRFTLKGL